MMKSLYSAMKKVCGLLVVPALLGLLLSGCDTTDEKVYTRATFKGGPGLVVDTIGKQLGNT